MPTEQTEISLQSLIPEAVASASYSLVSKNGFPLIFTTRSNDTLGLLNDLEAIEVTLKNLGYTPEVKRSFGGGLPVSKPVEVVANRTCPKCGNALHYFATKDGRKNIKCSTSKYDFKTQTKSGCDYTEWGTPTATPVAPVAPRPFVAPTAPAGEASQDTNPYPWEAAAKIAAQAIESVTPSQPAVEQATLAQEKVIKSKFPELWHEGMSKQEAYSIIQAQFSK